MTPISRRNVDPGFRPITLADHNPRPNDLKPVLSVPNQLLTDHGPPLSAGGLRSSKRNNAVLARSCCDGAGDSVPSFGAPGRAGDSTISK
jgi:hypothetical protein